MTVNFICCFCFALPLFIFLITSLLQPLFFLLTLISYCQPRTFVGLSLTHSVCQLGGCHSTLQLQCPCGCYHSILFIMLQDSSVRPEEVFLHISTHYWCKTNLLTLVMLTFSRFSYSSIPCPFPCPIPLFLTRPVIGNNTCQLCSVIHHMYRPSFLVRFHEPLCTWFTAFHLHQLLQFQR